MGDIVKQVDICGLDGKGRRFRCASATALVDSGASKTVISEDLAERIGGGMLGIPIEIEGRKIPLKLAAVTLRAKGCGIDALAVAVDDKLISRAGHGAEVILGHDYLQNKRAVMRYYGYEGRRSEVACPKPRKRRRR